VLKLADRTVVNLTNHPAQDYSPAWSPDGSKIAFASDRDGAPELYVVNADGSGVTRITQNVGFVGRPAWSPDGGTIAFDCEVETGNRDLCAASAAGTGVTRLTSDPAADLGPAWSPDGTRIAFATARFGVALEIAVMNADGGGVARVLAGTAGGDPSWSPDGGRIAFSHAGGRACDNSCVYSGFLGVMNADGTGLVWIGDGSNPVWRPRTPARP
jgi:Tol biopolymer transport system component